MKIAVIGCGAIGGLFLGYLSEKKKDTTGVVRDYQKEPFQNAGLHIEGARGKKDCKVKVDTKLSEKVDLAIFATKLNDLEAVVKENKRFLENSLLLTTQNGVGADDILNKHFPEEKIITGIVMFGATFYAPNKIVHNFDGDLILGNIFGLKVEGLDEVASLLGEVFNTVVLENIKGAKYLKIFINLNNCIPAILGMSMQEAFSDLDNAELAIRLNKEAYEVVRKSGIILESLPSYPKDRLEQMVSMDIRYAAGSFSKIMTSLSKKPLYGSILQSIKRGKKSEIDFINGEIVRLAQENNIRAALNKKIVALVHEVEKTGQFFTKDELIKEVQRA